MTSGTLSFDVSTRCSSQVRFCVLACPSGGFDAASSYAPSVTVQSGDGRFVMLTLAARSATVDSLDAQADSGAMSAAARAAAAQWTFDCFIALSRFERRTAVICSAR